MKEDLKCDELTGLAKRDSIMEYLNESIEKMEKINSMLAIAFIDVDLLKQFNMNQGHLFGDELLKRLAETLRKNLREGDLAGRVGGDEFLIIFPNTGTEVALILMEELRKFVEDTTFQLKIQEKTVAVKFTVSIGLAAFPKDARNATELQRKCDEAMYRAKKEGRNRVCLSPGEERMKSKTNFYSASQMERLALIARETMKSESFLLREALDDLIKKYGDLKQEEDTYIDFQLGRGLLDLVDPSKGAELLKEIPLIREEIEKEFGVILPGVRFRDNLNLKPLEYFVRVRDEEVARKELKKFSGKTRDEIANHLRELFRKNITRL